MVQAAVKSWMHTFGLLVRLPQENVKVHAVEKSPALALAQCIEGADCQARVDPDPQAEGQRAGV